MNIVQENIEKMKAQAADLEEQLRKLTAAINALQAGQNPARQMTVKDALLKALREENGQRRRDLPMKLASLGAPCTPNTLQFVIGAHKELFKRHGGKVYLKGTEPEV